MPPVTTTSTSPARIIESAISTARIDDAHTLLTVSAGTSIGRPAPTAAWRAGAWPGARLQHLAHDHVVDLARPRGRIRSSAARIAIAPSSVAAWCFRPPPSLPNGVRTAETMTRAAHAGDRSVSQRANERTRLEPAREGDEQLARPPRRRRGRRPRPACACSGAESRRARSRRRPGSGRPRRRPVFVCPRETSTVNGIPSASAVS